MAASTAQPIFPISEISAYRSGWTIKARVTSKGQLRTWSNNKGTGKVFHADLLDSFGGEIRANFFNQAVDQLQDKLQVGKVFTFSRGNVKIADRRFSTINHRYELVFDSKDAQVVEAADDAGIEAMKFSFVELQSVGSKPLPCRLDVCGIVTAFQPVMSIQSKDGRDLVKRELIIADDSATSMGVTLWGELAKKPDANFEGNPLIGVKGVSIREWNGGRSGSLSESGGIVFEPTTPEAQRVKKWWSQGGATQTLTALTVSGGGGSGAARANAKMMTIASMRRAAEGLGDKTEHYNVICRLSMVQTKKQGEPQPLTYMACQESKTDANRPSFAMCNRRVDSSGFCASCNRITKAAPRLMLRCKYADFEDNTWITTFHEPAEKVLGMNADNVQVLEREAQERGEAQRERFEQAIHQTYFAQPLQITVRAKLDIYQGEPRPNITAVDARPVNFRESGRSLLAEIREMLGSGLTVGAASGA